MLCPALMWLGVTILAIGIMELRSEAVHAAIWIAIGIAVVGMGVGSLRGSRTMAEIALIGLGLAFIGGGSTDLRSGLALVPVASIAAGAGLIGMGVGRLWRRGMVVGVSAISSGLGLMGMIASDFSVRLFDIAIMAIGLALIAYGGNTLRADAGVGVLVVRLKRLTVESEDSRDSAAAGTASSSAASGPVHRAEPVMPEQGLERPDV